jgi:multisubunit Na+/H+ antiporter MnhG subunit
MTMHPQMSQGNTKVARCIWLPEYLEAKILLKKFMDDIDHIHHVVHTPSLHSILDDVYARTHRYDQVKSGHVVLLLAIFASSTLSWGLRDCECGLFTTPENAHTQPSFWIKAIEDLLDVAHRTTSVSLEGIQGVIIAVFVMANLEGFSRRCRSLWNMALLLGRELQLHLIDHPSKSHLAGSAQAEMGRRVWWYLVASDWYVFMNQSSISF